MQHPAAHAGASTTGRQRDDRGDRGSQAIVVLGGSVTQLPLIRAALERGRGTVVVVDALPRAPGLLLSGVTPLALDFSDATAVVAALRAMPLDPVAITSMGADRAVVPQAVIASELGLPGLALATARAATDKELMHQRFSAAGVPHAAGTVVNSVERALRAASNGFDPPLVVKPVDASGQRGVHLVRSIDSLAAAARDALAASPTGRLVVEEYLDGHEYTVDGLVTGTGPRSVLVTRRLQVAAPPLGVCLAHRYPSGLDSRQTGDLVRCAEHAVAALGMTTGASHAELRMVRGRPRVIEVGARLGGGQVADLALHVTGVDMVGAVLTSALGGPLQAPEPGGGAPHGQVRFLFAAAGTVTAASVDAALELPGIRDAALYVRPGDVLAPLTSGAQRAGYVTVIATNEEELDQRTEAACAAVELSTR